MGAQQSTGDLHEAIDEVEGNLEGQVEPGVKLYKFLSAGKAGRWEKVTENCKPSFYDINEDTGKKAEYHLEIESEDLDVRVDETLGYLLDLPGRRVTFQANNVCWAMKFPSLEDFKSFGEDLNNYSFWNLYGAQNDEEHRQKELGADFGSVFFDSNPKVDAMDTEEDSVEEMASPEQPNDVTAKKTDDVIHGLVVGALENNFLLKGNKVDVLRNLVGGGIEDKGVSFTLSPMTRTPKSVQKTLTPSRVLLTQGERNMMMLTPEEKNSLAFADIETSRVVSTWSFKKDGVDVDMEEISHETKAAGTEERSTFLGLAKNRICRWDVRDTRGVVQESPVVSYTGGKDYARNTNFVCMATSGDGYVAVGSADGKVRLYNDKSLTMAKTAIPGLGAPITAVDVTYDGKWVLATTDHYLMIVKTTFVDDKGRESCGFTARMGGRGATPRLLRLRPEHVQLTSGKPMTKGKFTWVTESGIKERWIAATCGRFTVVWNFKKVKSTAADSLSFGGLPTSLSYDIREKEEEVVDTAFQHSRYSASASKTKDASAPMMVATPHRLFSTSYN